ERVPAVGFVVAPDIEVDLVDFEHARRRVDDHGKEHADRHHEDFRRLAQAEDQRAQSSHKTRRASGEMMFNSRSRVRADIFEAGCDLVEIVCTLMISSPPPAGAHDAPPRAGSTRWAQSARHTEASSAAP